MWALQPGQLVDVAASLTSCFRLHSKHATTRLRCRLNSPSIFPRPNDSRDAAPSLLLLEDASFSEIFGVPGATDRPHWRHIVLLAAAYSICLKPQCGHSTLTLAGDGLATG